MTELERPKQQSHLRQDVAEDAVVAVPGDTDANVEVQMEEDPREAPTKKTILPHWTSSGWFWRRRLLRIGETLPS